MRPPHPQDAAFAGRSTARQDVPDSPDALSSPSWLDDLPELEPILDAKARAYSDIAESAAPASEPLEVAWDDVAIEIPRAVWQLGRFNGLPRDRMSTVSGPEYGLVSAQGSVHHARSAAEFPQFVPPGQTLLLHLPGLAADSYLFCMAVTGEKREHLELGVGMGEDYAASRVRIRWNDDVLWHGWYAPLSHVIRALVPSDRIGSEGQTVSIENMGDEAIPLDAVWIEPYRLGHPLHVSLEEGHWLSREAASWVRAVCLDMPMPTRSEGAPPLPGQMLRPPTSSADYAARWEGAAERVRRMAVGEGFSREPLQLWWAKIREAAMRDQLIEADLRSGEKGKGVSLRFVGFAAHISSSFASSRA